MSGIKSHKVLRSFIPCSSLKTTKNTFDELRANQNTMPWSNALSPHYSYMQIYMECKLILVIGSLAEGIFEMYKQL